MRHLVRGRQLSRDTEHRKALRRNMVQSLFEHGKIRTTLPKAKEVRAFAEKLITLARGKTVNDRRRVIAMLRDRRNDGSDAVTGYTAADLAGVYQTFPGQPLPLTPGWGDVKPFTMTSGSEFQAARKYEGRSSRALARPNGICRRSRIAGRTSCSKTRRSLAERRIAFART